MQIKSDKKIFISIADQLAFSLLLALPIIFEKISRTGWSGGFDFNVKSALTISIIGAFFSQPYLINSANRSISGLSFIKAYAVLWVVLFALILLFGLGSNDVWTYVFSVGIFEVLRRITMISHHINVLMCEILIFVAIASALAVFGGAAMKFIFIFFIIGAVYFSLVSYQNLRLNDDISLKEYFRLGANFIAGTLMFWIQTGGFLIFLNAPDKTDTRLVLTVFSTMSILFGSIDTRYLPDSQKISTNLAVNISFLLIVAVLILVVFSNLFVGNNLMAYSIGIMFIFISLSRVTTLNLKKSGNIFMLGIYSYSSLIVTIMCIFLTNDMHIFMILSGILTFASAVVCMGLADKKEVT